MSRPPAETPWLHIPMEILDRELYPKLMLACEAAKQGWQCTIGTRQAVIEASGQLPDGLVYLKSVTPGELDTLRRFKKDGHRLVCLDEEGLVQTSLETLATARYCNETVAEVEKIFCWGDIQRDALRGYYPAGAAKFSTTGSPAADLWAMRAGDIYKERVDELHARYGKYIMIPSSFGVPNHFMGPEEALNIMKRENMFRNEADYTYYKNYHDYTEEVFRDFLDMLPVVAKEFSDYTIILRPHPAEKHDTWIEAAAGLPNVKVVFEGPVSPWLAGAEVILHWGSTTGIEAFMMGKPVVGFCPYPEKEKIFEALPHLVSIMTKEAQTTVRVLRDVLAKPENWLARYPDVIAGHDEIKKWIHNIGHEPTCETLLREFNGMNITPQCFSGALNGKVNITAVKEAVWRAIYLAAKIPGFEILLPLRYRYSLKSRIFERHKTKRIATKAVKIAVRKLGGKSVKAEKLAKNLFLIKAA